MKTKKRYYHFVVEVLSYDRANQQYKHWYSVSFRSKKQYEIWHAGFIAGLNFQDYPHARKIGATFVRYRDYKPQF